MVFQCQIRRIGRLVRDGAEVPVWSCSTNVLFLLQKRRYRMNGFSDKKAELSEFDDGRKSE